MLLACRGSDAAPIVRIRSVDADSVKFALDSGAAGIMFPFVNSVGEARAAVQYTKYPPMGTRGVAAVIRATEYGRHSVSYLQQANANSLVVVQIETAQGVDAAEGIAATEGVDVLFVGPMDLSVNLGCPGDFTQPHFIDALKKVIHACKATRQSRRHPFSPVVGKATSRSRLPLLSPWFRRDKSHDRPPAKSRRHSKRLRFA